MVERFDLYWKGNYHPPEMERDDEYGDWVRYSDYEKLKKETEKYEVLAGLYKVLNILYDPYDPQFDEALDLAKRIAKEMNK